MHAWQVAAGDAVVAVPALDATGGAHGLVRAVLRLTNRGWRRRGSPWSGSAPASASWRRPSGRSAGGSSSSTRTRCTGSPRATDGHDVGDGRDAAIVFGTPPRRVVADGAVVAGPPPAASRRRHRRAPAGMWRVRSGPGSVRGRPRRPRADRPPAWLDLTWAARLVTLAWRAERRAPVRCRWSCGASWRWAALDARAARDRRRARTLDDRCRPRVHAGARRGEGGRPGVGRPTPAGTSGSPSMLEPKTACLAEAVAAVGADDRRSSATTSRRSNRSSLR